MEYGYGLILSHFIASNPSKLTNSSGGKLPSSKVTESAVLQKIFKI